MSRPAHHQRQQQLQLEEQQQQMAENEAAALAAEMFDHFCVATTMRQVLGLYRNMCDTIGLRAAPLNEFYPKLKTKIRNWKAQALWKKFDARASHRVYNKGNACTGTRVLVIGAGPCGLRTAIEAQLLGAKVVVVEKRDRISRNNVLHLWPFVITDLRNLGAKKFYGKFCAGSIDHISIRQLQCILLKVALLLGVEVHEGVSFIKTLEPSDGCGWRAQITPEDHAVSHYEFDVLIGADGKRNTLEGFKRKELRAKLAIAITANFINKKTEAEAKAEEISGVAFIFNQSFFKELYSTTGIDLENIVYYKDETHYFVMTAKKHSLIDKGVILQDFADPAELLAAINVNTEKLLDYAREAAEFSTKYQMPNLEFAVNHYGKPDVAMFDFTSMFSAEISCRVIVRKNYRLLQCLVGDSLLEPFWPTGSGCARGFLSSMDAAYAIKLWNNSRNSILAVLAQRESIYRLLAQTTPENLQRDIGAYTVDPATRYPNLNKSTVNVWQIKHLLDTDDPALLEQTFIDTNAVQATGVDTPIRRKRRTGDSLPISTSLLRWIKAQLLTHEFTHTLTELSECFTNGKVLCALINRYRPDLVDFSSLTDLSAIECNELAFKIFESDLGIPPVISAKDSINLDNIDSKLWLNYLEQIYEVFRGEIPHVKHPKLDFAEFKEKTAAPDFSRLLKFTSKKAKSPMQDVEMANVVHRRSVLDEEKLRRHRKYGAEFNPVAQDTSRRAKKRRSHEKATGANIEERQQRLKEIEDNRIDRQNKRRLQRFQQTQNFYKSLHMLQANTFLRESDADDSSPFEDYSIYMYRQNAPEFNDRVKELERKLLYPDRERGIQSALPRGALDEQFNDRIKNMEQRITSRNAYGQEKKPRDLLRAIGKIESSDWNVREIEKKIEQSRKTETGKSKEKVPKWSRDQFLARQNKITKPTKQDSNEEKFKDIDQTLKNLDKQLKEGSVLEVGERGRNKVASIAGQFGKKEDTVDDKNVPQKSSSKVNLVFTKQGASEKCHFCKQTVYLMEKISTEGLILHRSCLKCHHCHTNLRLGGYAFDRDDPIGRFYCTQHFRLPAKAIRPVRKSNKHQKKQEESNQATDDAHKTPDRSRYRPENITHFDLLDRGQTPERIEFENAEALSDGEPSLEHIIDENEWTDRNFITGSEDSESDITSSESSDDDTDSDMFEEANGSPLGAQTLQLATDWIGKQRYSNMDDSDEEDFYDSSEGLLDDDADSQTEGEEFKKAREMRRQEVKVMPPLPYLPTDTETEVVSKDVTQQINTNLNSNQNDKLDINNKDNDKSCDKTRIGLNNKSNALVNRVTRRASIASSNPSKTEIKIIENQPGIRRRVSTEIDKLNENLYNLNTFIKLNKDIDNIKKDNLVKNDIMKKLSLKEKWLNQNCASQYMPSKKAESISNINVDDVVRKINVDKNCASGIDLGPLETESTIIVENMEKPKVTDDISTLGNEKESLPVDNIVYENKNTEVANTTEESSSSSKKLDLDVEQLELEKLIIDSNLSDKDLGKLLYDVENRYTSSSNRKMSNTIKNIEVKSFSDTMDTIKSQITAPKISKQSSCDLSKYFPNQKPEKSAAVAKNVNQKNLKDVDLTKYFPQSPILQRKGSLVQSPKQSPAMRRKSESAKGSRDNTFKPPGLSRLTDQFSKSTDSPGVKKKIMPAAKPNLLNKPIPKKNILAQQPIVSKLKSETKKASSSTESIAESKIEEEDEDNDLDIFDQLLDGAVDIKKTTKKIKIKSKSSPKASPKPSPQANKKTLHILVDGFDVDDDMFEEIIQSVHGRSPSAEYQKLFDEEKSPTEDVTAKIDKILEETVGPPKVIPRKKKVAKSQNISEEPPLSIPKEEDKYNLNFPELESPLDNIKSASSMTELEKTMDYLKQEWKTEATNFLQRKRESFHAKRRPSAEKEIKKQINEKPKKKTVPIKQPSPTKASKPKPNAVVKNEKPKKPQHTKVNHDIDKIFDKIVGGGTTEDKSANIKKKNQILPESAKLVAKSKLEEKILLESNVKDNLLQKGPQALKSSANESKTSIRKDEEFEKSKSIECLTNGISKETKIIQSDTMDHKNDLFKMSNQNISDSQHNKTKIASFNHDILINGTNDRSSPQNILKKYLVDNTKSSDTAKAPESQTTIINNYSQPLKQEIGKVIEDKTEESGIYKLRAIMSQNELNKSQTNLFDKSELTVATNSFLNSQPDNIINPEIEQGNPQPELINTELKSGSNILAKDKEAEHIKSSENKDKFEEHVYENIEMTKKDGIKVPTVEKIGEKVPVVQQDKSIELKSSIVDISQKIIENFSTSESVRPSENKSTTVQLSEKMVQTVPIPESDDFSDVVEEKMIETVPVLQSDKSQKIIENFSMSESVRPNENKSTTVELSEKMVQTVPTPESDDFSDVAEEKIIETVPVLQSDKSSDVVEEKMIETVPVLQSDKSSDVVEEKILEIIPIPQLDNSGNVLEENMVETVSIAQSDNSSDIVNEKMLVTVPIPQSENASDAVEDYEKLFDKIDAKNIDEIEVDKEMEEIEMLLNNVHTASPSTEEDLLQELRNLDDIENKISNQLASEDMAAPEILHNKEDNKNKSRSLSRSNNLSSSSKDGSTEKDLTEEDSIEQLFNELTDDILADLDIDSNDEIIIISRKPATNTITASSIEASSAAIDVINETEKPKIPTTKPPKSPIVDTTKKFPPRPARKSKSISSSPDTPDVPVRTRKYKVSKLNPLNMPIVEEILKKVDNNIPSVQENIVGNHDHSDNIPNKFPTHGDYILMRKPVNAVDDIYAKPVKNKAESKNHQERLEEKEDLTEYIEKLEKERRMALIKRDQEYEQQKLNSDRSQKDKFIENKFHSDKDTSQLLPLIKVLSSENVKNQLSSGSSRPYTIVGDEPLKDKTLNKNLMDKNNKVENELQFGILANDRPQSLYTTTDVTTICPEKLLLRDILSKKQEIENILEADPIGLPENVTLSTDSLKYSSSSSRPGSAYTTAGENTPYTSVCNLTKSDHETLTPTSSYENIPSRPSRNKSSSSNDNKESLDPGTQLLLDRSKMLHSQKEEFMNKNMAANNPYLKKMLKHQGRRSHHEGSDDDIRSARPTRPEPPTRKYFPSSRTIDTRRRDSQETGARYSSGTGTSTDSQTSRRNLATALGPRNFVEYFKRSPSIPKERESSKDSCVIS